MSNPPESVTAFWGSLEPALQSTIITNVTTVAVAVVGLLVVIWRIGHEATQAINQNKLNEAQKLKLRVYEEVVTKCEKSSDSIVGLLGVIRTLTHELKAYSASKNQNDDYRRISSRTEKMVSAKALEGGATVAMFGTLEKWEIIDPRLHVFKVAFSATSHEIGEAYDELYFKVYTRLPVEISPDGHTNALIPSEPLSVEEMSEIIEIGEKLIAALNNFLAYIFDLRVEMQNLLLGDLFSPNRARIRTPKDKDLLVISLEKSKEIQDEIKTKTDGGRYFKVLESDDDVVDKEC